MWSFETFFLILPSCLLIHVDKGPIRDMFESSLFRSSPTWWAQWAERAVGQRAGGEGGDRIQGFQEAPMVDQERGKTLETRWKVTFGGDGGQKQWLTQSLKYSGTKKYNNQQFVLPKNALYILWERDHVRISERRPTCCPKKVHFGNHPKDAGHQNPWQEEERSPLKMSTICFNLVGASFSPF